MNEHLHPPRHTEITEMFRINLLCKYNIYTFVVQPALFPSDLQILSKDLRTPHLARQTRQSLDILTRLPSTHRSRTRYSDPILLINSPRILSHFRPRFDIRIITSESALSSFRVRDRGRRGLECFEERDRGFRGQVFVVIVIDLDHWGVDAGAETFDFDEGEEAVFGCLAGFDAEVVGDGFDNDVASAASELAGSLRIVY